MDKETFMQQYVLNRAKVVDNKSSRASVFTDGELMVFDAEKTWCVMQECIISDGDSDE